MSRYVWKMCVLQHTFYKMHQVAIYLKYTPAGDILLILNISNRTVTQKYFRAPPSQASSTLLSHRQRQPCHQVIKLFMSHQTLEVRFCKKREKITTLTTPKTQILLQKRATSLLMKMLLSRTPLSKK